MIQPTEVQRSKFSNEPRGQLEDLLFVLSSIIRGPRASQAKSPELLDVMIWDIRIKHFISTARVYVHVTAVATIGLVCAMFEQPASMPPLQVSMALLGWIQHHVVATKTLTMNKARLRLFVLFHYVQCGAFVYGLPIDCEPQLLVRLRSFFPPSLSETLHYFLALMTKGVVVRLIHQHTQCG